MKKTLTILLIFCSVLVFGQTSMRNGLRDVWRMEDNVNGVKGNDGTATDVTYTGTGVRGSAARFNGTSSYIDNNDLIDFSTVDRFTVAMWVRGTSISSDAIFAKYSGSDRSVLVQALADGSNQRFRVIISTDGTYSSSTAIDYRDETRAINTSSWIHLAFSFDAGTLKMYHNGVNITGDVTKTEDASITTVHDSALDVITGGGIDSGGSPTSFWDGDIDEEIIVYRALTDLEVKNLYNLDEGLLMVYENYMNDGDYEKFNNYAKEYFALNK